MSIKKLFPELKSFKTEDFDQLRIEKPVLMIAMTARTGSTHLCSALSSVIDVPVPIEIFNSRGIVQRQLKQRNVVRFKDYMKSMSQDPGDYFIFKTSWDDFSYFKAVYSSIFPNLKVLYLNRLDVEQQAVSLYKANMSGVWHKANTKNSATKKTKEELLDAFNMKAICKCINSLECEKRSWESFFFRECINPVRVNYEDFESDVEEAIDFILQHFNINKKKKLAVSGYNKLFDEVSEEWLSKLKRHRSCNGEGKAFSLFCDMARKFRGN